ncbi:alpha/beta fold hydrolase [Nocardioides sp. GXZ039]|uniref:alpha/beta fold hydrolase n=1 Tax=Nocardioides sp. GXZ039 TaxID=3136018 RepID=UPI0030F47C60
MSGGTTRSGLTPGGVAYSVRGSGPPVLWLSGYVIPVLAFAPVLKPLARSFTVVAVDHRGTGRSRTRARPTTATSMAADAISVLDHLGLSSAHVVGTSLGGMVAQEIGIGWRHRVRSLALCSTTAGGSGSKTPPVGDLGRLLHDNRARIPGAAQGPEVAGLAGLVWLWGAMHQAAAAASHDTTLRLGRITAPTLVLHGTADDLAPVANGAWLARHVDGARWHPITGGTHLLAWESREARDVLTAWLEEHRDAVPRSAPPSPAARVAAVLEAPLRMAWGQSVPTRRTIRAAKALLRP